MKLLKELHWFFFPFILKNLVWVGFGFGFGFGFWFGFGLGFLKVLISFYYYYSVVQNWHLKRFGFFKRGAFTKQKVTASLMAKRTSWETQDKVTAVSHTTTKEAALPLLWQTDTAAGCIAMRSLPIRLGQGYFLYRN